MRSSHYGPMIEVPNPFRWQLFLPIIETVSNLGLCWVPVLTRLGSPTVTLVLQKTTSKHGFLNFLPQLYGHSAMFFLWTADYLGFRECSSFHFEKDRGKIPVSVNETFLFYLGDIWEWGEDDLTAELSLQRMFFRVWAFCIQFKGRETQVLGEPNRIAIDLRMTLLKTELLRKSCPK